VVKQVSKNASKRHSSRAHDREPSRNLVLLVSRFRGKDGTETFRTNEVRLLKKAVDVSLGKITWIFAEEFGDKGADP